MSNQTKQENAEMTQAQKTEEQRGENQQTSNATIAHLKVEQVEERANPHKPFIVC